MGSTRILASGFARKVAKLKPGLVAGCAGLALLSACAGGHGSRYAGEDTAYYLAHASHSYKPPGPPSDPWGPYIKIAAQHFDVPQMWIRQVMRVESGGHEYSGGHLIVSSAGAMGLMQLEPGTYQEMAERYGLGNDPFNPLDNIMAGAAYIHEMYQIYGSPGFLAAYNAGPGRLDSYINYHRPLPDETKNYVAMIAPNIDGYYPKHRSPADELALNTEPMGRDGGILPRGFTPEAPTPSQLSAPVEIASLAPAEEEQASAPVSVPVSSIMPQVAQIESARAQQAAAVQASSLPPAPPVQAPRAPALPVPPPAPVRMASAIYTPHSALPPPPPRQASMVLASNTLPVPPPAPSPHRFSIIPSAMAATPPREQVAFNSSGGSSWGIQVGAYDSSSNAKAALGMAELTGANILHKAQPVVMTIHTGGSTKYRARFVGLQHDEAVNACNRLSGGPTGCEVLSPDAQS
ncbi:lytic transglycosylase domain-containing protein [Acidocella aminolytica]|nr:lytic transglycosylase domain-containing protein [Acidocella aminolytica]SHE86557.1 Sporulation related domain-containing protein [Acidocella aminolytica 101 = DSM 11237]